MARNTPSRVGTAVSEREELLSEGQPFTGGNLTDLPSVGSCSLGPWLDGALEATPFSFLETHSCFWTAVFQGTESLCCRNAGFSCCPEPCLFCADPASLSSPGHPCMCASRPGMSTSSASCCSASGTRGARRESSGEGGMTREKSFSSSVLQCYEG